MARPIVLVAASGLALEVAEAAVRAGRQVIGCVDDDEQRWGSRAAGWLPVIGGVDALDDHPEAELVLCAGRGLVRDRLAQRLGERRPRYATVIHPSVDVPASCTVGEGTVILGGCVLTASVRIGDHVVLMPHATLTHDDVVEDFVTLAAHVSLGGGVRLARSAYLGMGSSVRERLTVGEGATIGMGSVVLGDVPPGETWAGVPARRLPNHGSH